MPGGVPHSVPGFRRRRGHEAPRADGLLRIRHAPPHRDRALARPPHRTGTGDRGGLNLIDGGHGKIVVCEAVWQSVAA